ncbi:MAG: bifunctional phosphoribosylaminoimidazolecarboxamide formyltransferase/IMP cyclohydrolase [Acidobacteriales bacterium]|nr:bifunctional phosphoribosylaminoimidazolecarboxamide formyltransferase/IMP cyclohydrolase [Terriglobales bacterium]
MSASSSFPQRALVSVTDKSGIVDFARRLAALGIEIVSTGGTYRLLRENGVNAIEISDLTGFPEMLDGRVKTLHPRVHGGILHVRGNPEHKSAVEQHGIKPIDMVVVNLYEFEKTAAQPNVAFEQLIENIDIGGPAMIRSAAKNFQDVAVITSPADYQQVADELERSHAVSIETKWRLAQAAFRTTAAYDSAIASVLAKITQPGKAPASSDGMPSPLALSFTKLADLRYGENPHQRAAVYSDNSGAGIANGRQLQGKELSYNNLVDLEAAWDLAQEFDTPACAIIKHTNPCGTAAAPTLAEAYRRALESDPVSAFGGVIGVNREVEGETAREIAKLFVEAIAAPGYTEEARAVLSGKKNLRLLEVTAKPATIQLKQISGGMLAQDADSLNLDPAQLKVVSQRQPTQAEMDALRFAWTVCKHVKSNAIVYARQVPNLEGVFQSVGVGAGQMSRVDSCRIGAEKAVLPLAECVAASDAFFPFPDGVEVIAKAGATAIIQPGGSVRDAEVIAAVDRLGIAMVVTGVRHFRH